MEKILTVSKEYIKKIMPIYTKYKEIITYLIAGGLTTIVNLGVYYGCVFTFLNPDIPFELQSAIVLSWVCAVVFAYFINKIYVFESTEQNKLKEATKFVGSRIITLLLDMFIMFLGVTVLSFNDKFIRIVSQVLVVIANYVLCKLIVFKKGAK